jgi:hypothetical protein
MAVGRNKRRRIISSTVATATTTYGPFDNLNGRVLRVTVKCTAIAASPSVVPKIQSVSPGGVAADVLTGVAMTATGEQILTIGPDLAAVANVSALAYAPSRFNLVLTHGDADAFTFEAYAEELA